MPRMLVSPKQALSPQHGLNVQATARVTNNGFLACRTEEGKPLVLNVVHTAEQKIVNRTSEDKVNICKFTCGASCEPLPFLKHAWRRAQKPYAAARRRCVASCCTRSPLTTIEHPFPALQEYLGITGNPRFNDLSAKLAFGERSAVIAEKRNATVQALSGTGALRVRLLQHPCQGCMQE